MNRYAQSVWNAPCLARQRVWRTFVRSGVIVALAAFCAPTYGQDGEITRCGITIDRPEGGEIANLEIRLTEMAGLDKIPLGGDLGATNDWMSQIMKEAKDMEGERSDVTIQIKNKRLDYGRSLELDDALIITRHGYSWNPNTCGKRVDNPNVGTVSVELTPLWLTGSFSGSLYVCERRTAILKGTTGGTFQCALPILHDPGYEPAVAEPEARRAQAEMILLASQGGDGSILRPVPPGWPVPTPAETGATQEEWDCDCSCPVILDYGAGHRCRQPCGPEWRYEECRTEAGQAYTEETPAESEDVCELWERVVSGDVEMAPQQAQMLAVIGHGMDKNCNEMSDREKEAFGQMLRTMLGR